MTDAAVSSAIGTAPVGYDGDRNHAVASTLKNKQERSSRNVGQHSLFHFLVSFSLLLLRWRNTLPHKNMDGIVSLIPGKATPELITSPNVVYLANVRCFPLGNGSALKLGV